MYDIVIIGKGPAGISAAIYALRANKSVAVVAKDGGALENVEVIENYYGFADPISGKELLNSGYRQAQRLGAEIIDDEIISVCYKEHFIASGVKNSYESNALILATGAARKKVNINGLSDYEGHGVSYCAICDGFFFRRKRVAVLGTGEYALGELKVLLPLVGSAFVLTDGQKPTVKFPAGVEVITEKISALRGSHHLEEVVFTNGEAVELDGLFIAVGTANSTDIAKKLGIPTQNNKIITDNTLTGLPGFYAAGDCTAGLMQVAKAVSDGATAATYAVKYLNERYKPTIAELDDDDYEEIAIDSLLDDIESRDEDLLDIGKVLGLNVEE